MASIKDKAVVRTQQSEASRSNKPKKSNAQLPRKPRRPNTLRFREAAGKTVDFIEMDWTAAFPCVEVAFDDHTALLFELGAQLTMEPSYSNWKTGNQRLLRRWPRRETDTL